MLGLSPSSTVSCEIFFMLRSCCVCLCQEIYLQSGIHPKYHYYSAYDWVDNIMS